ncbi:MAG: hypothetical protein B7Z44_15335 [Caulobacter sp. 12-67-6]|nr:MAG: hypothetical protein B7Z44_15335 [Caulobacter sp. 12-67-6]HQR89412.1 hypothetical protein [Caulobacter sp.]
MARLSSDPFSILQTRFRAWETCIRIPGCDKAIWRQDAAGRVIRWTDFGDRFSRYGWEMRSCPSDTALGRALKRHKVEAIHWRGVLGDDARHAFELPKAA